MRVRVCALFFVSPLPLFMLTELLVMNRIYWIRMKWKPTHTKKLANGIHGMHTLNVRFAATHIFVRIKKSRSASKAGTRARHGWTCRSMGYTYHQQLIHFCSVLLPLSQSTQLSFVRVVRTAFIRWRQWVRFSFISNFSNNSNRVLSRPGQMGGCTSTHSACSDAQSEHWIGERETKCFRNKL